MLTHQDEYIRGWAIQLLMDMVTPSEEILAQFAEMAASDRSALVRLHLASALQKIDPEQRWEILAGLTRHEEDAGDHNLPLTVWEAAGPMAGLGPGCARGRARGS